MPVHVLDDYYLAITALVTVAYQLFFFSIAFSYKFDKLTDFAGGTNFVVLAALTLGLSQTPDTRQIIASILIICWGVRLSGFLLFRILKTGKDDRFDDKRDKFFPFLGFWVFQMFWVWLVSLPVTVLNSPAVRAVADQPRFGTACDIAGTLMAVVGFLIETESDRQKFLFRMANHGDKSAFLDKGLFSWSRHPNYFGEILVQFGLFTIAVAPAANGPVQGDSRAALYVSILGPVFLTVLLMFVSGLTLQERSGAKRRYENGLNWNAYSRWLDRTSILIPFPPQLYARMPTVLKRTLFLEFPIYVFDPAKHADPAVAQGQGRPAERQQSEDGLV